MRLFRYIHWIIKDSRVLIPLTAEPFPPKRTKTKSYIIHELPKRVADTYLCQDQGKLKLNYIQLRRPHKMPFIWENYIKSLQRRTYLS